MQTTISISSFPARGHKEQFLERPVPLDNRDFVLVRRIASGDAAALRALYTAYGQRLFAYAVRLTCNPALAEDVLQDSLIAAWQGAPRFREQGRVLTWLLGIVHHKSLNAIRQISPSSLDEGDEDLQDDVPALDEQMAGKEQADLLRAGLDSLSIKHRVVLELVFYQGLNLNEVAEVCGCPVGTVKSRLSYAKEHLRRVLERAGLQVEDLSR